MIILNSLPYSSLHYCELDLRPPHIISLESDLSSLFTGFLSTQANCDLVYLPVIVDLELLWLAQDQHSSTPASYKTFITTPCSVEIPSWSHSVAQVHQIMETSKDIEEIKASLS